MSDDERKKQAAWAAAWTEIRIRHCLREAATVAHIRSRSSLRDEFILVAAQTFDEVADELEAMAKVRPEWPKEAEFAVAVASDSAVTVTGDPGGVPGREAK